jgi:hypothetical protein
MTATGPVWHRYNGDGYGEHADGREFDGTGIGRAWPLLTGERGHYELLAGNDPQPFLRAMSAMAGSARASIAPERSSSDIAAAARCRKEPCGATERLWETLLSGAMAREAAS